MTNSTISTGLASMGGDFAGFKHPADTKVMSTYTPVGGGIASIGSTIGPAIADTKVMSPYTPVGGGIASIGSTIGPTMPMMYPSMSRN